MILRGEMRHCVTLLRGLDGIRQKRAVALRSIPLQSQIESGNRSRNIRRKGAIERYATESIPVKLWSRQHRRWTRAIDERELLRSGKPGQYVCIPAKSRLVLFGHGGHIKDGGCSINCIPAGLEDSQSGARLKRMLSGDHTIHAHHDRAPWPSFRPLLLLRDQSCSREEQGTSKENEIPFVRCHSYRSPWAPSSARAVMRCKFPLTNCTSASAAVLLRSIGKPVEEQIRSGSSGRPRVGHLREFEACFSAASSRLRFSPNPTISGARRLCSRLFIFVLQSGHFVVRVSGKLENRFQLRRHAALVVLRNGFESLAKIPFFYSFYPVKFGGVEAQNLSFVFHGNVRMAEGCRYTDRNNQKQEHTNWHSLVFSGELPTSPRRTKRATASSSKERS